MQKKYNIPEPTSIGMAFILIMMGLAYLAQATGFKLDFTLEENTPAATTPDTTATAWRATDNAQLATLVATFVFVTPTQEFLATNTPAQEPCWQVAKVTTGGSQLLMRVKPAWAVNGSLSNGASVTYDKNSVLPDNVYRGTQYVMLTNFRYVALPFLTNTGIISDCN